MHTHSHTRFFFYLSASCQRILTEFLFYSVYFSSVSFPILNFTAAKLSGSHLFFHLLSWVKSIFIQQISFIGFFIEHFIQFALLACIITFCYSWPEKYGAEELKAESTPQIGAISWCWEAEFLPSSQTQSFHWSNSLISFGCIAFVLLCHIGSYISTFSKAYVQSRPLNFNLTTKFSSFVAADQLSIGSMQWYESWQHHIFDQTKW